MPSSIGRPGRLNRLPIEEHARMKNIDRIAKAPSHRALKRILAVVSVEGCDRSVAAKLTWTRFGLLRRRFPRVMSNGRRLSSTDSLDLCIPPGRDKRKLNSTYRKVGVQKLASSADKSVLHECGGGFGLRGTWSHLPRWSLAQI